MSVSYWITRRKNIFPYVFILIFTIEYLNPEFLGQFFTIGKIAPALLLGAYIFNVKGNFKLRSYKLFRPLLLFSIYFILSLIWSPDILLGWQRGMSFILLLTLFWFVAHFTQDEDRLRHFFGAFILISNLIAFLSIINFIKLMSTGTIIRTNIFSLNSHFTALLILIGTLILIVSVFQKQNWIWGWLPKKTWGFLLAVNILGFFTTGLKTGAVALIIISFVLYIQLNPKNRWKFIIMGTVFFILLLLINLYVPFLDNYLDRFGSEYMAINSDSFSGRISLWKEAWNHFVENPFLGIGLEGYKKLNVMNTTPHNDLLRILAEGGIIGGVLWIIVIVKTISMLLTSLNMVKKINNAELLWYTMCNVAIMGFMLIFSQAHDMIFNKIFWIILGITQSVWSLSKSQKQMELG